ncbi:MAG: hypothetical protein GY715_14820 [Planctomycetes bacterium]|nr:hypothetical protein [Planctomycetota bacterium]
MNTKALLCTAAVGAAVIALGQIDVGADTGIGLPTGDHAGEFTPTGGVPDVWVFKISGLSNWSETGFRAYSVGTTSCNTGSAPLTWTGGNSLHPVIGQGMYRLAPGHNGHPRLEMLGQSWLKHGFCALDQTECTGSCVGTGCGSLGLGCSDPYTSGRNGSQGPAGPKWQVNATTGVFPYPPADPSYSGATARRLKVLQSDVDGGTVPGTKFFLGAMYIHPEDSASTTENAGNNASYREVNLSGSGFASSYQGLTVTQVPAISAWATNDPTVTVRIEKISGEGDVWVAYKVYDNLDGTWDYEYAVYNMNVDRSIGSFVLPINESVTLTDVGFRDVDYHSGDGIGSVNFDGTDWPWTHQSNRLTYATETYAANQSANAIRWGTMYNFRFTANTPPEQRSLQLGVFKPGAQESISVAVLGPEPCTVNCGPACAADLDGSGDVGFGDVLEVIANWGCTTCPDEDISGNGTVDFADILAIIAAWGPCP